MKLKRSILTALGLLIMYNALIAGRCMPPFLAGNQWLRNEIAAQQYLYRKSVPSIVVTGSSLSQRLVPVSPDVYNMGLAGSTALLGLQIIQKSGRYPAIILVETNTLRPAEDEALLHRTFDPLLEPVRRRIPSQRIQNQPVNYLMYPIAYMVVHWTPKRTSPEPQPHRPSGPRTPAASPETAETPESKPQQFAASGDASAVRLVINRLEAVERDFSIHGTKLVYFAQPLPPGRPSEYSKEQLDVLERWLSGRAQIPPPRTTYSYSDGYHLTPDSAAQFSAHLEQGLQVLR